MKKLRTVIVVLVLVGLGCLAFSFKDQFVSSFVNARIYNRENHTYAANKYYRALSVPYVSDTENFTPKNRQQLLNVIYTVLNSGLTSFNFYCDESYTSCVDDVSELINDETILSNLNNFVHPFNSYSRMYVTVNSLGEVTIKIEHLYSKEDIDEIEKFVNKIIKEKITSKMTTRQKIKVIHDYIINNTKYDSTRSKEKNVFDNISHKANGLFKNGYAICSGYADTMAIFLNKLGIMNYKIASEEHVWNYVFLDGQWLHLDLTWDDPVTNTGDDIITYDYFLITDEELIAKNSEKHHYDEKIYK